MSDSQPRARLSDADMLAGQAAALLLVERLTVRKWVKQGKLREEGKEE